MARCQTCGAALEDASQRFCGGDRCARVFMKHAGDSLPGRGGAEPGPMRWQVEFYNERRGILARCGIDAPLPAAVVLGQPAVLAGYPSVRVRGRLSCEDARKGVHDE